MKIWNKVAIQLYENLERTGDNTAVQRHCIYKESPVSTNRCGEPFIFPKLNLGFSYSCRRLTFKYLHETVRFGFLYFAG